MVFATDRFFKVTMESWHDYLGSKFPIGYQLIHMVFTTARFFKVAIESWLEWDLNSRALNSVQTL